MAAALELHRAGRQVLVIDAGGSPEKVCGEGLLPPGWLALEALGVAELVEEKAPITELVYRMPDPRTGVLRSLTAPIGRPSFGVRREVLCRAFARAAEGCGLEIWRPARFRGVRFGPTLLQVEIQLGPAQAASVRVDCRYLIGADGLHSTVRREAGLQSAKPRSFSRWGTRIYLRNQSSQGVTVTLGDGVESYMTPLGGDLSGLAFIWSPQALGRPLPGTGPIWHRLLDRFPPSFREALPPEEAFFGSDRAIGPLHQLVTSPLHPSGRIALVGDAAGYLDALTGEGLCLGMLQAQALTRLLLQNRVQLYPAQHRAIKLRHQFVIHLLLRLFAHPALKERAFSSLLGAPGMFAALIAMAVQHDPWHRLINPDLPRFLRLMLVGR
jgi:2-polyprenyl-6-methoxyphenol hydroxylase-like FAD-dependent oxidoreductase